MLAYIAAPWIRHGYINILSPETLGSAGGNAGDSGADGGLTSQRPGSSHDLRAMKHRWRKRLM